MKTHIAYTFYGVSNKNKPKYKLILISMTVFKFKQKACSPTADKLLFLYNVYCKCFKVRELNIKSSV